MSKAGDRQENLQLIATVALANVLLAEQGRQQEIALVYSSAGSGFSESLLIRGALATLIDIYTQIGRLQRLEGSYNSLSATDYL